MNQPNVILVISPNSELEYILNVRLERKIIELASTSERANKVLAETFVDAIVSVYPPPFPISELNITYDIPKIAFVVSPQILSYKELFEEYSLYVRNNVEGAMFHLIEVIKNAVAKNKPGLKKKSEGREIFTAKGRKKVA